MSVPDMGRVVQMSTLFGVSTDYLLKDGLHFQYGVYDICPFDYGDPGFTLPIEQLRPYLSDELLREME